MKKERVYVVNGFEFTNKSIARKFEEIIKLVENCKHKKLVRGRISKLVETGSRDPDYAVTVSCMRCVVCKRAKDDWDDGFEVGSPVFAKAYDKFKRYMRNEE